jgi:molybdopterin-guanine dinucleotide biosynthesis protein A
MTAELNGLVLAGGFSSRMGEEKGLIRYHGFPQYLYAMQLLRYYCNRVYLVCRPEQQHLYSGVNIITDLPAYAGHGPVSGLLSAFDYKPGAWMVLACDHPYIDKSDLKYLIKMRNHEAIATAFKNEDTGYIEPLTAIYEKHAHIPLKRWFMDEQYSLRRFLESNNIVAVAPEHRSAIISVDSAEEKKQALNHFRV